MHICVCVCVTSSRPLHVFVSHTGCFCVYLCWGACPVIEALRENARLCVSLWNCVCVRFNTDGWDLKSGFKQSSSHPDQGWVCVRTLFLWWPGFKLSLLSIKTNLTEPYVTINIYFIEHMHGTATRTPAAAARSFIVTIFSLLNWWWKHMAQVSLHVWAVTHMHTYVETSFRIYKWTSMTCHTFLGHTLARQSVQCLYEKERERETGTIAKQGRKFCKRQSIL